MIGRRVLKKREFLCASRARVATTSLVSTESLLETIGIQKLGI